MRRVVHLLSGLTIGGKERVALQLAERAMRDGDDACLLLYDTPFRSRRTDFHPGDVPLTLVPRHAGPAPLFVARLATALTRLRPDVVHAHNPTALVLAVLAAGPMRPRPRLLATFHAWPSSPGRRERPLCRIASRFATIVSVSQDLADRLVAARWVVGSETVLNGVDTRRFSPSAPAGEWRARLGIPSTAFVVGHVARLDPIKRHADLLSAAESLQDTCPDLRFVLVGDGPLAAELRERAKRLGNVHFVPFCDDMPGLLRALDGFVLCSDHEATPLALLEAMSCGLPIVATRVGGMPAILKAGEPDCCGLLVPPRDAAALASGISRLIESPETRSRLALGARQRALEFGFEQTWRAYARLYGWPVRAGGSAPGSADPSGSCRYARNDSSGSSA